MFECVFALLRSFYKSFVLQQNNDFTSSQDLFSDHSNVDKIHTTAEGGHDLVNVQMPDQPYTFKTYAETHFNQKWKNSMLNKIFRRALSWAYSKVAKCLLIKSKVFSR